MVEPSPPSRQPAGSNTKAGILIPTYLRPHFLDIAVRSALTQSSSNVEIIVIDNGRSDPARDLVHNLNDPRLRYVRNDRNLKLTGSIRKGIESFSDRVSWVTVLPDDDLLDRDFINTMLDFVLDQPKAQVVHGHLVMIDAEGGKTAESNVPPDHETAIEYLLGRALFLRHTFLCGIFFSRDAYNSMGGYPEFPTGMATDDALIYRLSLENGLFFNRSAVSFVRQYPEAESYRSADAPSHIRSFEAFRTYVHRASMNTGLFTSVEIALIEAITDHYVNRSITGQWLRLLQESRPENTQDLKTVLKEQCLPSIKRSSRLPLRILIDAFMVNRLRWNPEHNGIYRKAADHLQNAAVRKQEYQLRRRARLTLSDHENTGTA